MPSLPASTLVISQSGARLATIHNMLKTLLPLHHPKLLLIHGGTNNINKLTKAEDTQLHSLHREWITLTQWLCRVQHTMEFAVVISNILPTMSSVINARIQHSNQTFASTCNSVPWHIVQHLGLTPTHLRDTVHLNHTGEDIFFHDIQNYVV